MKKHMIALALASLSTVGAVSSLSAFAATSSNQQQQQSNFKQQMSDVKNKCSADISKYCSDVTPGQGRIASCLKSKDDKLSDTCRTTFHTALDNMSKRMDRAEVAFRKQCGTDVQKFCSNTPSGQGRLLGCLQQHESDLSASCKNFQAKLDQKLGEYLG